MNSINMAPNLKDVFKHFLQHSDNATPSTASTLYRYLLVIVLWGSTSIYTPGYAAETTATLPYQCPDQKTRLKSGIKSTNTPQNNAKKSGKLNVSADHINRQGDKVLLDNAVKITKDDISITAQDAVIDRQKQILEAKNGLRFQSSQIEIGSDYLKMDLQKNTIEAQNAFYQLKSKALRGKASQLKIDENGTFSMDNASFSSCPAEHQVWAIKAKKITIDPKKGSGIARNLTFRIQDIPIIYLPYMQFPTSNKRLSGLLTPTFRNSGKNGQEITLPYYWNIAPNYDATTTPRFLSDRGLQLINEFRYLNGNHTGTITAEYLKGDKKALGLTPKDRYRFHFQHESQFNENWKANIDFDDISDDNYFFDLGSNLTSSNIIQINRRASIDFNNDNWHIRALTSSDQTLNNLQQPYRQLPQVQWQSQFPLQMIGKSLLNFDGELAAFEQDNTITANRLVIEPTFSYPMDWRAGYIHPKFKYNYRSYQQKDPLGLVTINKNITTPMISLDSGAYLERNIQYNNKKYLQTLEPRFYYLYVPARDQQQIQLYDSFLKTRSYQQLFQDNRYSGYDRIGDSNQMSLGINTRILALDTGEELLSFGIGQAYFFEKRKVSMRSVAGNGNLFNINEDLQTKTSPLLADLIMNISQKWRINATFEWQPDSNSTKSSSFRFQYQPSELNVVNLGHRRRLIGTGENIEQLDFSFSWKIHRNWRLIGRWYQDLSNNKNIETLFGAEYDSCCWAIRIVNRRYLSVPLSPTGIPIAGSTGNYTGGPSIQFILKGFSSLGRTGYLANSISGYKDPYDVIGN